MDQISDAPAGTKPGRSWPLARLLVLIIGLGALLSDSLQLQQPRFLNVHLLFGALLLTVVVCGLLTAAHSQADADGEQFCRYTRQLARQLYILLYVLAAVRICLYFIEAAEAGAAGYVFHYPSRPGSLDDFQIYIAYGLAAACLIRGSTMLTRAHGAPWIR